MPNIAINCNHIRNGSLPSCCIVCGRPAVDKLFPDVADATPPSSFQGARVALLYFLSFWLLIVLKQLFGSRHRGGIPFCEHHRHYWPRRAWFIVGGFTVLIALFINALIVDPHWAKSQEFSLTGVMLSLGIFIFLPAFLVVHLNSVRPVSREDDELVFAGVDKDFATAVRTMGDRVPILSANSEPIDTEHQTGHGKQNKPSSPFLKFAISVGTVALILVLFFLFGRQKLSDQRTGARLAARASRAVEPSCPVPKLPIAGILIPAPGRVDMVHDAKRNLLYITAGDSVLLYDVRSNVFRSPIVLGGNLQGIDLSMDNDLLAVADRSTANGKAWIHLVHLNGGTDSRIRFPAQPRENGTYSVAFGADGGVWITSSLDGAGWVPLRKYDPNLRTHLQLNNVAAGTMLAASSDRQTIAFAQANVSPGNYGQFNCRATRIPQGHRAEANIFEIGISQHGDQLAVPGYDKVTISGSATTAIDERETIGVAYHPLHDFVCFAQAGSSLISMYETTNYQKVKQLNFGYTFKWVGARAFQEGRLRISRDGALIFCTVDGGIRYAETGL